MFSILNPDTDCRMVRHAHMLPKKYYAGVFSRSYVISPEQEMGPLQQAISLYISQYQIAPYIRANFPHFLHPTKDQRPQVFAFDPTCLADTLFMSNVISHQSLEPNFYTQQWNITVQAASGPWKVQKAKSCAKETDERTRCLELIAKVS